MSENYYCDTDRWIVEENNGKEIPWVILESYTKEGKPAGALTFVAICPGHHMYYDQDAFYFSIKGVVYSDNTIDAMQKMYDLLEFGTYNPHPSWNVEKGCWNDTTQ